MSRPRVYLSGPITLGDRTENFAQACQMHKRLMELGVACLNPMLSMLHPDAWNIEHGVWLECDLPWVAVADAVFRIPGESKGAEMECEYAEDRGIPVFVTEHDLLVWMESRRAVA